MFQLCPLLLIDVPLVFIYVPRCSLEFTGAPLVFIGVHRRSTGVH